MPMRIPKGLCVCRKLAEFAANSLINTSGFLTIVSQKMSVFFVGTPEINQRVREWFGFEGTLKII